MGLIMDKERERSEHIEQREFVFWFRKMFPQSMIFAIPNGGQRSKISGMKLKLEGVVPGIPDLMCPELFLFIEMKKTKKGQLSKEQEIVIKYLNNIGYTCIIGYGCEDAKKKTLNFLESKNMIYSVKLYLT